MNAAQTFRLAIRARIPVGRRRAVLRLPATLALRVRRSGRSRHLRGVRRAARASPSPRDAPTAPRRTPRGGALCRRRAARRVRSTAPRRPTATRATPGTSTSAGSASSSAARSSSARSARAAPQCVNPCLDSLGQRHVERLRVLRGRDGHDARRPTGVCYAVFVVNQWKTGEPAKIEVDRGGAGAADRAVRAHPARARAPASRTAPYDPTAGLPDRTRSRSSSCRAIPRPASDPTPDDPRVLANCPRGRRRPPSQGDASLHGTGMATAFHIKTNVPVVAYQMLPYGGGQRARDGVDAAPADERVGHELRRRRTPTSAPTDRSREARAGPTTVIIASQDGTHVTHQADQRRSSRAAASRARRPAPRRRTR